MEHVPLLIASYALAQPLKLQMLVESLLIVELIVLFILVAFAEDEAQQSSIRYGVADDHNDRC